MDLSTYYLGFKLPHPLMVGAAPLPDGVDTVKRLEDAGAAAVVLPSLFEEQLILEEMATNAAIDTPAESFAEALSYFPRPAEFRLGPGDYLQQIRKIKAAVRIPIIASLNGVTPGGWLDYAKQIVSAGADALELNIYYLATDPDESGESLEQRSAAMVRSVKQAVPVPLAVKLSPFYTALPHFARQLESAGADALVLFNRFYQPDVDVETLEVTRHLELSTSAELLLRLRWLAILSGHVRLSLAVSGGVHCAQDALKAIMTGANAVQVVSAILRRGPGELRKMHDEMAAWIEQHEYASLDQMVGSMNLSHSPDPGAYERANYMHILQGWRA